MLKSGHKAAKMTLSALAFALAVVVVHGTPALAGKYRGDPGDSHYPWITVTGRFDATKSVSAPVRQVNGRDQVRLPGGAWVWCGINCFHTLRNATIDFWERYDVFPR